MSYRAKVALIAAVLLSLSFSVRAENEEMRECILRVSGEGDMAVPGISCSLIGTVDTGKEECPDLLVLGDKWYGKKCYRYSLISRNSEGIPLFKKGRGFALPQGSENGSPRLYNLYGKNYLFWHFGGKIYYAQFIDGSDSFGDVKSLNLPKTEHPIQAFAVESDETGRIIITALCISVKADRGGDWRTAEYHPYDAAGRYNGTMAWSGIYRFSYQSLGDSLPSPLILVSGSEEDLLEATSSICDIEYGEGGNGFIAATRFGGIYYYLDNGRSLEKKRHCVGIFGTVLRHPTIGCFPILYSNSYGNKVDILASGEGGVYYYRYLGHQTPGGNPIYSEPQHVREINPMLHGGSLITPNVVDWDGDGVMDIVCGNSAGYVLFMKNVGTNAKPSFESGIPLKAEGHIIHIQPGYGEDVQGPVESRWGYVGAYVYDWDGDEVLDILINDSRGRHTFWRGDGQGGLFQGESIFVNDLELHGTWRCRPGVGKFGDLTAYVTLDDDDDVHLYAREDNRNLHDMGKLHMTDGRNINANSLEAGGKGRVRFELVDWDGDGIKDLLLSTNENHQIPDPVDGLPWSRPKELRGATILFMRNAGTERAPSFEYPVQLKYKGVYMRFGHHACGSSPCHIGPADKSGLPNLLVGDEKGSLYLVPRSGISW